MILDNKKIEKIAKITGSSQTELNQIYKKWSDKKGDKSLTVDITLLADLVGVSISSISNFINRRYHNLSKEKKMMIQEVVEELQYVPSRSARLLKSSQKMSVAFIGNLTDGVSLEYFLGILKGVQREAKLYRYNVDIFDVSDEEQVKLFKTLPFLGVVDGVILVSSILLSKDLQRLKQKKIPIILVGARKIISQAPVMHSIFSDISGLEDLLDFVLIQKGYRDPVLISVHPEGSYQREQKIQCYYNALKKVRIPVDGSRAVFINDYSINNGRLAFKKIYQARKQKPDIVLCFSDIVAMSLQQECHLKNIEVGITGYSNMEVADLFRITTIDEKLEDIGKAAFQKFYVGHNYMKIHHQFPPHESLFIKSSFVRRASC